MDTKDKIVKMVRIITAVSPCVCVCVSYVDRFFGERNDQCSFSELRHACISLVNSIHVFITGAAEPGGQGGKSPLVQFKWGAKLPYALLLQI